MEERNNRIFPNFVGLYREQLGTALFYGRFACSPCQGEVGKLTGKWYGITIKSLRYKEKSSLLYKENSVHSARTDIHSA